MEHKVIRPGEIHVPHQWRFINSQERLSATITNIADIDKLALQVSDGTYWRLVSTSPTKWQLAMGQSFTPNATGNLDDRGLYDSQKDGFAFLATDTGNLYIRQGASGNWSDPIPFGKGEPGEGVPDGGSAGQVLTKNSGADYDAEWKDVQQLESTDDLDEGTTNKYFTMDRVRETVLEGISFVSQSAVTASDTVLSALGKLQKQILELLINVGLKADKTDVDAALSEKANVAVVTAGFNTLGGAIDDINVRISNVSNTSDADKPVSTAQQTALDGKENSIAAGENTQYWRGDKSWQALDKSAVGLDSVNNTADADKPVSTAQQEALNKRLPILTAIPTEDVGDIHVVGVGQMRWLETAFGFQYVPVGGVGGACVRFSAAQVGNLLNAQDKVGSVFNLWDTEENCRAIGLPERLEASLGEHTGWTISYFGDASFRRINVSNIFNGYTYSRAYVNGEWLQYWTRSLDDINFRREAGSYTPVLRGTNVAGSHTYTDQQGSYLIQGGICHVEFRLSVSVVDTSMSGYATISLPMNPTRRAGLVIDSVYGSTLGSGSILSGNVEQGSNCFLHSRSNLGDFVLQGGNAVANNFTIYASASYPIA
jgi:hypothetical protein